MRACACVRACVQDRQYVAQYETQEFVLSTESASSNLVVGKEPKEPKSLGTLGKAKSFFGSPGSSGSFHSAPDSGEKKKPGLAKRMSLAFMGGGGPKAEPEV